MRYSLVAIALLFATIAFGQDPTRRVEGEPVTVSGVASPLDTIPVSSSFKRITPTQLASQISI